MLEMDWILNRFLERELDGMDDADCADLAALLATPDTELFRWITGMDIVPAHVDRTMIDRIAAALDSLQVYPFRPPDPELT